QPGVEELKRSVAQQNPGQRLSPVGEPQRQEAEPEHDAAAGCHPDQRPFRLWRVRAPQLLHEPGDCKDAEHHPAETSKAESDASQNETHGDVRRTLPSFGFRWQPRGASRPELVWLGGGAQIGCEGINRAQGGAMPMKVTRVLQFLALAALSTAP